jgi:hypothetical protein
VLLNRSSQSLAELAHIRDVGCGFRFPLRTQEFFASRLLGDVSFVFKHRQGVKGDASATLPRQGRQDTNQLKPDFVKAFCAGRKYLPLYQGDLVR